MTLSSTSYAAGLRSARPTTTAFDAATAGATAPGNVMLALFNADLLALSPPPEGFVHLTDDDGALLTYLDGAFLVEAI